MNTKWTHPLEGQSVGKAFYKLPRAFCIGDAGSCF